MLVHRPRLKTQGAAVMTVAMLALGACDDPTARTDLRPEGDPEVLAVLVLNDAANGLVESATYCKSGDEKRPGLVGLPDFSVKQICPETLQEGSAGVANAAPELWYIRIMFDELLDPTVEDLIPELDENNQETGIFTGTLRNTQPVTLQCRDVNNALVDVDYDGYYSPSGNNVTWPLGPSLVIKPLDPTIIPVDSECEVTIKDGIKDKSGNAVPTGDRGPFKFKISSAEIIGVTPADGATINPEVGRVDLTFNVEIDAASFPLAALEFCELVPLPPDAAPDTERVCGPAVAKLGKKQNGSNGVIVYGEFLDAKEYRLTLASGTKITDKCGRASEVVGELSTTFKTNALSLVNIIPFQGPNAVPSRKIRINFNQIMDLTTLVEGEDYEWLSEKPEYPLDPPLPIPPVPPVPPAPLAPFIYDADRSIIIVNGVYKLNTNYKFRLKKGATISDCPGRNTQLPTPACATPASTNALAIEEDQLIDITTAPAISITATSVAAGTLSTTSGLPSARAAVTVTGSGGQTIHKNAASERVFVRFDFNQDMDSGTLANSEFTLTTADGAAVTIPNTPGYFSSASPFRTTIDLGPLAAGSYKFTLKAGAAVNDRLAAPNTFTQSEDRGFTFNVEVDEAGPAFKCLGQP
jgi:hypothetical protein